MIVQAEEIVDKVARSAAGDGDGLIDWASDVRLTLGVGAGDQIIIMIKGLTKYFNKTKSIANREFTAAARAGLGERDRLRRDIGARIDKDVVERELVKLQGAQRCFLVHGTSL